MNKLYFTGDEIQYERVGHIYEMHERRNEHTFDWTENASTLYSIYILCACVCVCQFCLAFPITWKMLHINARYISNMTIKLYICTPFIRTFTTFRWHAAHVAMTIHACAQASNASNPPVCIVDASSSCISSIFRCTWKIYLFFWQHLQSAV